MEARTVKLDFVKSTKRNISAVAFNRVLNMAFPFLNRTLFLWLLGPEYLGLNGLFRSVLGMLSLAELGFFPLEWLNEYYCDNGKLSGHISHHIPGVEFSTGSLGHGLPVACGMAMAAKQAGKKHRVFCLCSDGDLNEGSTWEAIMLAAQHHWDNLVMLVDYNRLQALGKSRDIIDLESLKQKLEIFGWAAREVDGHDQKAVYESLRDLPLCDSKPSAVIFRTVKGKGVSFMENDYRWHYGGLTDELLAQALKEVEEAK